MCPRDTKTSDLISFLMCVSNKDWMFSNEMPTLELVSRRLVLYENLKSIFLPPILDNRFGPQYPETSQSATFSPKDPGGK